jgi:hypothetical protein
MGLANHPLLEASIDTGSAGDNVIIVGAGTSVIRVYRIFFVLASDTNLTFKNGATPFDGTLAMLANGSVVLDFTEFPWFVMSPGANFIINLSAPSHMGGRVYYTQSTP